MSAEEQQLIPQFAQAYKQWHVIIDQATSEAAKSTPESNLLAQDLVLKSAPIATTMNTALDSLAALQAGAGFGHT